MLIELNTFSHAVPVIVNSVRPAMPVLGGSIFATVGAAAGPPLPPDGTQVSPCSTVPEPHVVATMQEPSSSTVPEPHVPDVLLLHPTRNNVGTAAPRRKVVRMGA